MLPAADSAGQPFEGRSFSSNPFAGDSGEADPTLRAALAALGELLDRDPEQRTQLELATTWGACVTALGAARVLSPLIAEAGDYGVTETGALVEKIQELSVPHLEGPDGRAVAPVFSDVAAMAQWNSLARPIPVEGARAALAAASEGLALVLDPGSPDTRVFRRSALEAAATGHAYVAPWVDEHVRSGFSAVLDEHPEIVVHRVVCGDPTQTLAGPEVMVVIGLVAGLSHDAVARLVAEISTRWANDPFIAGRCDGVGVKVLPA
jgi:hypothetical protein